MRKINSMDDYKRILLVGTGYIYNDFSPSTAQADYNILHLASCRWLKRSNLGVDKYFFNSLIEAEEWLDKKRSHGWRKCRTCLVSEG